MSEQPPPEPVLHPFTAHLAKHAFRAFLPLFAHYWAEAREAAPPDLLNAAIWPHYERLLRACQDILAHAPMHPNEAKQVNVELRFARSLERLATTLATIFPHGFMEFETYVVTDHVREWRRARGVARYRRVKKRSRSRRRR